MNLETQYIFEGITISTRECNNTKIVANKVKITNKQKQRAQNKTDKTVDNFMRIAQNERKKEKKQAFYNKFKK